MISYGFNSERKSEGIMIDDSDDDDHDGDDDDDDDDNMTMMLFLIISKIESKQGYINDIYHSSNLETLRIFDRYMRVLFVIVIKDRYRIIY